MELPCVCRGQVQGSETQAIGMTEQERWARWVHEGLIVPDPGSYKGCKQGKECLC